MTYLYSYTCLLFPSGHTKQLGDSPGTDFQHVVANNRSMSEVRRARLNQVSHLWQLWVVEFSRGEVHKITHISLGYRKAGIQNRYLSDITYRISANSFRGNYSFLNLAL